MENKLLVGGSAIAVVVLVLASLSPVVGFHSVKSNSAISSPLFSVRIKRVNNEEQDALTCDYVGKGQLMPFPRRDSKTVLVQKFIDSIGAMDDREFDRFIDAIIRYLPKNDAIQEENSNEFMTILYQLKNNPNEAMKYITLDDESPTAIDCDTIVPAYCPTYQFRLGCFLFLLFQYILVFIYFRFPDLYDVLYTLVNNCF